MEVRAEGAWQKQLTEGGEGGGLVWARAGAMLHRSEAMMVRTRRVWQDALLLTGLSWTHRCTVPPPDEVTMHPPWCHAFQAVSVPNPETLAMGSYSTFCNNVSGAHKQTNVLPAVIKAVDVNYAILQEWWDLDRAASFIPPSHLVFRKSSDGRVAGLLIVVRRSKLRVDSPICLVHDAHHWVAVLVHIFPLGRLLIVNVHLRPHVRYGEWLQEVCSVEMCVRRVRPIYLLYEAISTLQAPQAPRWPPPLERKALSAHGTECCPRSAPPISPAWQASTDRRPWAMCSCGAM